MKKRDEDCKKKSCDNQKMQEQSRILKKNHEMVFPPGYSIPCKYDEKTGKVFIPVLDL